MELLDELGAAGAVPSPPRALLRRTEHQLRALERTPLRRGLPRRWIAAAVAVAGVAGAGSIAWAVTGADQSARFGTTIECGLNTYIPVESGDPIADCQSAMSRQGSVPPLDGWLTPDGLVAVLPVGVSPPAGSTPLPAGFSFDKSILYVNDVLSDEASPIVTSCTTAAQAHQYAVSQLALAGLSGWDVQVDSTGAGSCAGYVGYLDTEDGTAVLQSVGIDTGQGSDLRLDEALRAQLQGSPGACATRDDAVADVEADAQHLGIPADSYQVNVAGAVGGGGPSCAIVTIDPGGSIEATVWLVPSG